jgi:hypothetical protein
MVDNIPKYNKKFKLCYYDGTLNKSGPGYDYNSMGNFIITKHIVYHQNIDKILLKQISLSKKKLAEDKEKYL